MIIAASSSVMEGWTFSKNLTAAAAYSLTRAWEAVTVSSPNGPRSLRERHPDHAHCLGGRSSEIIRDTVWEGTHGKSPYKRWNRAIGADFGS